MKGLNLQDIPPPSAIEKMLLNSGFVSEWRGNYASGQPRFVVSRRFRLPEVPEILQRTLIREGMLPNDMASLTLEKSRDLTLNIHSNGHSVTYLVDSEQGLLLLRYLGVRGTECPLCGGPRSLFPTMQSHY